MQWSDVFAELAKALTQPQGTIVAAIIAFCGGLITAGRVYRQKSDELFFNALNFLKGGSQNRNLGIAAIELYWRKTRHRPLCVSLLAGSAIYLIRGSKSAGAAHEIYNLRRIMQLLLSVRVSRRGRSAYEALRGVVDEERADRSKPGATPTGVHIDTPTLDSWSTQLTALLS